jgi:hypothetical protein
MRIFTRLCAAALALAGLTSAGNAAVVFSDNFDGYADQAAYQAAWPVVGTQPSTTLSSAQSVSAPNSVLVPSSTTTATSPRNQRTFAETGSVSLTQQVVWSFDFFDDAPTAAPYRQHANLQDGATVVTNGQLIAMGMNNNQSATNSGGQYYMGRILGYTVPTTADPDGGPAESVGGASAFFKLNDFTAPHRSAGWHNLKVIVSTDDATLGTLDYAFYVDNVLAERVSNIANSGTGPVNPSWDLIRVGSGVSSPQLAYYDNFNVEVVPEPASLGLIGLSGIALLARRRRRAA